MPTLNHNSKRFAIDDAKVAKVTADPAGGVTTYGPVIDVPGIKSVTIGIDVTSKELRGDNGLLDVDVVFARASGTINYAKNSMDMHAVLLGATVADSGVTPAQVAKLSMTKTSRPGPFKFEGRTPASGVDIIGGDEHIVLYKCIINGFGGFGFGEEDYDTFAVPFIAFARLSDGNWIDDVLNETATVIV